MLAGIVLSTGIGRRIADRSKDLAPKGRAVLESAACVCSVIVFLLSVGSLAAGSYNPFIYFRF